jgi:arabinose-5-phosphate isomerase
MIYKDCTHRVISLDMPPAPKEFASQDRLRNMAKAVIETEAAAIYSLLERIDESFTKACEYLLKCNGRIVVMGMGKSGHVANKIAATLASTGSPAFFVHPAEASHGDMGMITRKDVVLALSNSGETTEILMLLPLIKRLDVPLIAMTGKLKSTLAQAANIHLDVSVEREACPLGLAPTSSTTVSLVMGDAISIALLEARGFTPEDFALTHPGGMLGRRLLLKVDDIMHTGDAIPRVREDVPVSVALIEMTKKRLGMTTVVDMDDKLVGIYTDGDLRRTLTRDLDIHQTKIGEVMTRNFKTIQPGLLAAQALQIMETYKITSVLVILDHRLLGVVHMHDLLQAGVV